MKVLVIGPSETRSRGGMAAVIRGIRESKQLNKEFDIDIFPSYIDGSLPIRLLYSLYVSEKTLSKKGKKRREKGHSSYSWRGISGFL